MKHHVERPASMPERIWDQLTESQIKHYLRARNGGSQDDLDLLVKSFFREESGGGTFYG